MAGREHPEKPPITGAPFEIIDGKYVRLRRANEPLSDEVSTFLVERFRENESNWQLLVDGTMAVDRPEEWLYPLGELIESYYPELGWLGGGGVHATLPRLLARMRREAFEDPTSYRAGELQPFFLRQDETDKIVAEKIAEMKARGII